MHTRTGLLAALAALSLPAGALEFELGDARGSVINELSVGAAWRVEAQDPELIGRANVTEDGEAGTLYSTNSDDGNLSFEQGDLIAAAIKLSTQLDMNWGEWGVFVRGSALYDPVLYDHDYFDAADYVGAPTRVAGPDDLERKRDIVGEQVGLDADLLDAYIYGGFNVGDRYLSLRIGKQVLNWGEATFVQHGLNALVAAETAQLRVPGFEFEEVLIPAGMVLASIDLSNAVSLEAFYQFDWQRTRVDPVGTYFSTNDFVAEGGQFAEIGFGRCPEHSAPGVCPAAPGGSSIPRGPDRHAKDDEQGGVSLRFYTDALGGVETALYAANIHSRLPLIGGRATLAGFEGVAGTAQYFIEYPEDIKLFGASFNLQLPFGGIAMQGEYSLKQDQPLQLDEVEALLAGLRVPLPSRLGPFAPGEYIQAWRRHDVSQAVLGFTKITSPIDWLRTSQVLLLFEAGATQVHDFPDADELPYEGPNTVQPRDPFVSAALGVPVQPGGYATDFSWGYRALARLSYPNAFNRFNIEPTLVFAHDVEGVAPTPVSNFIEDRKEIRALIDASYLANWRMRLAYTSYFGGGMFNQLADRDNVSLAVSYSF